MAIKKERPFFKKKLQFPQLSLWKPFCINVTNTTSQREIIGIYNNTKKKQIKLFSHFIRLFSVFLKVGKWFINNQRKQLNLT